MGPWAQAAAWELSKGLSPSTPPSASILLPASPYPAPENWGERSPKQSALALHAPKPGASPPRAAAEVGSWVGSCLGESRRQEARWEPGFRPARGLGAKSLPFGQILCIALKGHEAFLWKAPYFGISSCPGRREPPGSGADPGGAEGARAAPHSPRPLLHHARPLRNCTPLAVARAWGSPVPSQAGNGHQVPPRRGFGAPPPPPAPQPGTPSTLRDTAPTQFGASHSSLPPPRGFWFCFLFLFFPFPAAAKEEASSTQSKASEAGTPFSELRGTGGAPRSLLCAPRADRALVLLIFCLWSRKTRGEALCQQLNCDRGRGTPPESTQQHTGSPKKAR